MHKGCTTLYPVASGGGSLTAMLAPSGRAVLAHHAEVDRRVRAAVAEAALEARRQHEVVAAQLVRRLVAEPDERRAEAVAHQVEHVLHAGLSVRGEPPQVGPADHHGFRAQ